jgi:hypothetical protein
LDVGNPGNDGWNKDGKPIVVDADGNEHESGHGMDAAHADAYLRDQQQTSQPKFNQMYFEKLLGFPKNSLCNVVSWLNLFGHNLGLSYFDAVDAILKANKC